MNQRDSGFGASRWGALLLATVTAALAGCGDGPICQSEALVIIQSPNGVVESDTIDVRVRTTFPEGVEVTLQVLDGNRDELSTVTGEADANGDVLFEGVELAAGAAFLHASADAGECGSDEDEVSIEIGGGTGCDLEIRQTPVVIDFYAPLGVLNASLDTDGAAADFQGDVDIATRAGEDVELFVTDSSGTETSLGTATADDTGAASFAVDLPQGVISLRAACGTSESANTVVVVDTEAPDCQMTNPVAGSTITPAYDDDGDIANGVQLALEGNAGGGDVAGEPASFTVTVDGTPTTLPGTDLDASGDSTVDATIDPDTVPGSATIAFATRDHAQNACSVVENYDVVYDGCTITVESPTATVTQDADADPTNGAQIDVDVHVSAECAGEDVVSTCGSNDPSGTTDGSGDVTLTVDWCDTVPCDLTANCTFSVTSPAGIETSAGAILDYDDQAPPVGVQIAAPAVACGSQITPSADIDGNAGNGVQIQVRVVAPLATSRTLDQTDGTGTQSFDATPAGGLVTVTLGSGTTSFVGTATDDVGNTATSNACTVTLADIAVGFSPPAADGSVGAADGIVTGSDLTFSLCGTVSDVAASVGVTIDGGASLPALVTGTTWCVTVTLAGSPPDHTIVATATDGPLTGSNTLILSVDLSAPDPITDLAVIADTRQSLTATWTAPADSGGGSVASYVVKVSTTVLTDANFDATGELIPAGTPGTPGTAESLRVTARRTGTPYWMGIAAVDSGGNRGAAAIVGPVTPLFDQTAAITPPVPNGNTRLGYAIARGRFNDDDLWDVAVSAVGADAGALLGAGVVYVYFGTPDGIQDVPDVEILGTTQFGGFGIGLSAVNWSSATREDLVIGEPYSNAQNGRVYIFEGGPAFGGGSYPASLADIQIGVAGANNYFTGGGLGWSLAALDFDGDGAEDLAIGDVAGGAGNGGVAIVYGGTVNGSQVLLSNTDSSQLSGAVVHLVDDPSPTTFDLFGSYVIDVGRTMGAGDTTEDLLVNYADGANKVFVLRGSTSRPSAEGVYARGIVVGQDVRIDYVGVDSSTELGASAGSVSDLNGDGARDLVIGAHRQGSDAGQVLIVDGNTLGTSGIALTSTPGVVITTIAAGAGDSLFGSAIVDNAIQPGADVDGDGAEDLLVATRRGGLGTVLVWFGGSIPTGAVTADTAQHVITGPSVFNGGASPTGGTPDAITWAGDVNGDGLADVCWGNGTGNGGNGAVQVLWDDGT